MKTLIIRLTSPLQSYGNEATFSRRTSGDYPSKSAIIGMVAAALGYHRDDSRISSLDSLAFGVRVDQPGTTLMDFQTVEWKKNTRKITYRDYLQDAVFLVGLGSDDEQQINAIKEALKRPKFQLFLGRRSNVPAGVLKMDLISDVDPVQALKQLDWQASGWYQRKYWRQNKRKFTKNIELIADANLLPQVKSSMVKDRVISFDQRHRQHGYRAIALESIDHVNLQDKYISRRDDITQKQFDTGHDIFGAV